MIPSCSARATAISVGDVREATTGTSIRAAFRSISDEMRPVESSRRSAVDKIKGEALRRGIPTADRLLLSTGRISSEMLLKAARMEVPVVASRTSPTEMAVALAEQLGITVCGYVRPGSLNVYAGDAVVLDAPVGAAGD